MRRWALVLVGLAVLAGGLSGSDSRRDRIDLELIERNIAHFWRKDQVLFQDPILVPDSATPFSPTTALIQCNIVSNRYDCSYRVPPRACCQNRQWNLNGTAREYRLPLRILLEY